MEQHVTSQINRAIAAGNKNHTETMESLSEVNKSVDNMTQGMTSNHEEAMKAAVHNESLLKELNEKNTDLARQVKNQALDTICANEEQHEETRNEIRKNTKPLQDNVQVLTDLFTGKEIVCRGERTDR